MIDLPALRAADAPLGAFADFVEAPAFGEGPFSGVRVGVKANIAVAGLPWTAGLGALRDRIAARDAQAVARLRAGGAAILGTLNMEEAAFGAKTDNPWFGATQNPHRIGHTPGGSSGGSGAAVAAGLCDVALGTDTLGSVRIPAAYCGVYGFKPANDRIGQDGLEVADAGLDCIGPLARSIDMLERAARAISDFGEGETGETVVLGDLGGVKCEAAVLEGHARARRAAGAEGEVRLGSPLSRVRHAGFIRVAKQLGEHLSTLDPAGISPELSRLLGYGARRSESDWAEDRAVLEQAAREVRAALAGGRMLLMPTTPQAAFPHADPAPANQADFTCLANIAGCAAISLPAGWNADGLPVAVQILAEPGREAGLFEAARRIDAALDAYRPPNAGDAP